MFRTLLRLVAVALVVSVAPGMNARAQGAQRAQEAQEAKTAKPRTPKAAQAGAPSLRPAPATKPAAIINLNTATLIELEALPGVGAKTAARIMDYRQKKGPFRKIEELMNVQGIGEKSFLKLKPQITVAGNAPASHVQ